MEEQWNSHHDTPCIKEAKMLHASHTHTHTLRNVTVGCYQTILSTNSSDKLLHPTFCPTMLKQSHTHTHARASQRPLDQANPELWKLSCFHYANWPTRQMTRHKKSAGIIKYSIIDVIECKHRFCSLANYHSFPRPAQFMLDACHTRPSLSVKPRDSSQASRTPRLRVGSVAITSDSPDRHATTI